MKIIICILGILVMVTPVMALDVTLEWDANIEPDLAGYRVYRAEMSGVTSEAFSLVNQQALITETTYVDTVDEIKRYVWQITAVDEEGNESKVSNVVIYPDPRRPIAPTGLKVMKGGP